MKYNELPETSKEIINLAQIRFDDCFDNDDYSVWLAEYTNLDEDRWASFLEIAIGKVLIGVKIPLLKWTIERYPYRSPLARAVLILAITIEAIMHFIRSYVEIPNVSSVNASMADRRDYLQRWKDVLRDYQDEWKDAMKALAEEIMVEWAVTGRSWQTLTGLDGLTTRGGTRGATPERPVYPYPYL